MPSTAKTTKEHPDFREEFTNSVIAAIESGEKLPWEKSWGAMEAPRNAITDKQYAGMNRLFLAINSDKKGYSDPRYLTFKQAVSLGGAARKGEHGVQIEKWDITPFWKRKDVEITLGGAPVHVQAEKHGRVTLSDDREVGTGSVSIQHKDKQYAWRQAEKQLSTMFSRTYTVFNVEQCDGLEKLPPLPARKHVEPEDRIKSIAGAMEHDGLTIKHGGDSAHYAPLDDKVQMPNASNFKTLGDYQSVLLHEIGHSTGAEKRLAREGVTSGQMFGSAGYAKEELRAELFSAFMAMETGISRARDEQHQAYLASWAETLGKDKNEIFRAASDASKAVDYVLEKERELVLTKPAPTVATPVMETPAVVANTVDVPAVPDKEKPATLYFLNDPGHGWLRVPREIGQAVDAKTDVFKEISHYSYASPAAFYLEEDSDANKFQQAAILAGYTVKLGKERHVEQAGCRDMAPFNMHDARMKLEVGAPVFARTVGGGKWGTIEELPDGSNKKWVIGIEGAKYGVTSNNFFSVLQSPDRHAAAVKLGDGSVAEVVVGAAPIVGQPHTVADLKKGDRFEYSGYSRDESFPASKVEVTEKALVVSDPEYKSETLVKVSLKNADHYHKDEYEDAFFNPTTPVKILERGVEIEQSQAIIPTLGDKVRYIGHSSDPLSIGVVEGTVIAAQPTSTGNIRYRLETDKLAPHDGQPIDVLVYSHQGSFEKLGGEVAVQNTLPSPTGTTATPVSIESAKQVTGKFDGVAVHQGHAEIHLQRAGQAISVVVPTDAVAQLPSAIQRGEVVRMKYDGKSVSIETGKKSQEQSMAR